MSRLPHSFAKGLIIYVISCMRSNDSYDLIMTGQCQINLARINESKSRPFLSFIRGKNRCSCSYGRDQCKSYNDVIFHANIKMILFAVGVRAHNEW